MDEAADGTNVAWREWGPAAFEAAEREGKPLLLSLVTPWCAECHEMDASTYTEPRIAANINDGFVPVRVDADRQPRIRERYNMGGFPSTVFLTPSGRILTGATFLGVDGFRGILDSVRETWDGKGETAGSLPRALRDAEPPVGTLDESIEEAMVEQLLAAYDDEFGGWGTDVKFPLPQTIEFALVRARDQAVRTLEAIRTHLLDTYDGGFYRFARQRNWREARREKLLDENAALVRAFLRGYRYTGEEAFLEPVQRTFEYLQTDLWTGDAFAASQGGDESYYRMETTERADVAPPAVDQTILADRNGLAIAACCWLAAYTDDDDPAEYARRARAYVAETLVDDAGRVRHFAETDTNADRDAETDGESDVGLLLDQARFLTGLTASWSVLGEPGPARVVADWTIEHLLSDAGVFMDGLPEGAGLLEQPLFPLDTNAEMAGALLDLSLLTGEARYAEAAERAVEAFAGASDRMGVEVARFATVASRVRSPAAIEVGAPAGSDLHRAALRLADHETVVVPEARAAAGSDVAAGAARLVEGGEPGGSAESPAALETLLTGTTVGDNAESE